MYQQKEKTLAIIKPDAIRQKNAGKILTIIEENNLSITALKLQYLTEKDARAFYHIHEGKSFFEGLISFMISGPCIPMILEGENALERWRTLMGPTDPGNAPEGTIRQQFGSSVRYNAVHGSDSPDNAQCEICFFFAGIELAQNISPAIATPCKL